jgi:hypothetical protein
MEHYVGLDVSLKLTAICIVDRTGRIQRERVVHSDPEDVARLKGRASSIPGELILRASVWLWPGITPRVKTRRRCHDSP